MTVSIDVECPDYKECGEVQTVELESEDAGDGMEHEVLCACGRTIKFNITYSPSAENEEFIE
jgi:hypothetical protein